MDLCKVLDWNQRRFNFDFDASYDTKCLHFLTKRIVNQSSPDRLNLIKHNSMKKMVKVVRLDRSCEQPLYRYLIMSLGFK